MKKRIYMLALLLFALMSTMWAQKIINVEGGLVFQKTQYLYLENGVGVDLSSKLILNNKLHVRFKYLSSRLGSAIGTNAIKQDNFVFGLDWRFRSKKALQILAGLNTGYFIADYGNAMFDVLPSTSKLLSPEVGLVYHSILPLSVSLTTGYNVISGNGDNVPGSLFPLYYQLGIYYRF